MALQYVDGNDQYNAETPATKSKIPNLSITYTPFASSTSIDKGGVVCPDGLKKVFCFKPLKKKVKA